MFFGTDSKNILDKKDRIKTTKNKNEVNFIIKQQSLIIAKLTSFLFLIFNKWCTFSMFYKKIKCDKITFNKVKNAYKKVFRKYSSKQYFWKNFIYKSNINL